MGVEGLRPQRPRALLGSTAAILRPFGSASFTPASRRSARPIDGLFSANNGHALTNLLGHTEVQNLRAAHSPIRVFVPTLSDRAAVHKTNNAVKATSHPNLVIPLRSCGRHCGPAPARSKPFYQPKYTEKTNGESTPPAITSFSPARSGASSMRK
jgi:hypothetical protein